jgi:phosphopantothenoylcysteine decarboxylase / phosphopantothenate---cysteine ligase
VRLVSGPVSIADPHGVNVTHVETARQMLEAVTGLLPADAAVMVAAVADWRTINEAGEKIKKQAGQGTPVLTMIENPDILATIGHHASRPKLVIGFAAETQNLIDNAQGKLARKGADMIVANDVSISTGIGGAQGVMGGNRNRVRLVTASGVEDWPEMNKDEVAVKLAALVAERLK